MADRVTIRDGAVSYEDGVSTATDQRRRLCELLGLDPAEIVSVRISFDPPGPYARVCWDGYRRIPLQDAVDAIEQVTQQPGPDTDPEVPC